MNKKQMSIRVLAEVAIFAAIAFVLDLLQGGLSSVMTPFLVNGGSIGIAMVPILIISYRRGLGPGLLCGLIVSLIQMLQGIYVIPGNNFENQFMQVMGPVFQVLFDYILAYTVVGFAGIFSRMYKKSTTLKQKIVFIVLGSVLGGFLKYLCHMISGWIFWPGEMWGISGWLYSLVYNGTYCLPNIVLSTALMVIFARFYQKFFEVEQDYKDLNKEVND